MKKRQLSHFLLPGAGAVLLLALLITAAALPHSAAQTPSAPPAPASPAAAPVRSEAVPEAAETDPASPLLLRYVQGIDGFFLPEKTCTRAEFAQILHNLGLSAPGSGAFADVPAAAWYAPAVAGISGILEGYDDHTFRPAQAITLAELTVIHCRVLGVETDAAAESEAWYAPAWRAAAALGWHDALEGAEPETPAQRWMVVSITNRALGRTPDEAAIDALEGLRFLDLAPGDRAYYDIIEAASTHDAAWSAKTRELPAVTPGLHQAGSELAFVQPDGALCTTPGLLNLNGETYLVQSNGRIAADGAIHLVDGAPVYCQADGTLLKNGGWHDFYFDAQGRYTSGDAKLDESVEAILAAVTTPEMTDLEKLRACYDHVRAYGYLGRNATISDKTMPRDKAIGYANKIYDTGKGDCYNFAAAFYFLAKRLGYDATAVVGRCAYSWGTVSHGWVEIPMDGAVYLFDPQIENYNIRRGISNAGHSAFRVTYETATGTYFKN